MATNYTTRTAALRATKADMRQVQVSKKIEIGKSGSGTTVSDKEIETDKLIVKDTREGSETEGQRTDIMTILSTLKSGIDVGTTDNPYDNKNDSEGAYSSIAKINFKGAYVNVVPKDDGTVDLWINPDNNYGKIDGTKNHIWTAPTGVAKKYVFDGDSYDIPTTNGSQTSTAICHAVANNPQLVIKGVKDGVASTTFSIPNLTTKIKAVVYDKAGTAKATCTTDEIKAGTTGKTENGITINLGSVTQYYDDLSKEGAVPNADRTNDAAHGFVPGTVSLTCTITPTLSTILGEGNVWEMKAYLVEKQSDGTEKDVLIYDSTSYFAYTTKAATISADPTIVENTIQTRWVSGVEYIKAGSTFDVTYGTMSNTTYMVADNATKRGTIGLSGCGNAVDISGSAADVQTTVISGGTKTFTLAASATPITSLTATHTAISAGGNATKTKALTTSKTVWASGTNDTAKQSYFETEDGDWKRLLGYMEDNKLILSESAWDSTQDLSGNATEAYNKSAKVYNGKCEAPSGGGTRYYVRKFNYGGSNSDQLSKFNLTVPGVTALNTTGGLEVWMWAGSNLNVGRRCDLGTGNTDPYGFKGVGTGVSSGKITVEVAQTIMQGEDFYVAVKIPAGKSITGDMVLA